MILQALTAYYEQLLKQGKVEAPGWDSKFKDSFDIIRQEFTCQKSLTVNRPPSAYEQALSWLVYKRHKSSFSSASRRSSDAGAFACRFFGNFPERCRSPPSFRFTRQPVNRNGGT